MFTHWARNRFRPARPVTVASIALFVAATAMGGMANAQGKITPDAARQAQTTSRETHTANTTESSPSNPLAATRTSKLLVLGDSLSAEYGLPRGTGWVALLSQRLNQSTDHYIVTNGSISGDTTSDGLSRLPNLLKRTQAKIVIVELGGNDALRGLPLATTRANLTAIIGLAKAANAKVLLVGMQIPPNYGPTYTRAFASMYGELAKQYGIGLVPFLLNGIADKPELFQADQIHPVPQAQPELLNNVWTPLQTLIHAK